MSIILVVEDDKNYQHSMTAALRAAGHMPIVAENEKSARQACAQCKPEDIKAVVLDSQLTYLGGSKVRRKRH